MSYEELFRRAEASGVDGAFLRVDESHPVGIFLGLESGQRAMMIVCPRCPPEPPSLSAIHVEARPRNDETWALVIRLARLDLMGLFTRLVEDLVASTRQLPSDPGRVVVERLIRWQRLLSRGALTVLDDRTLRGLAAELNFLVSEAIPAVGARAAVAAWVGPFEAPKDFVFEHAEVEVKAVHRQSRKVTISSLEQLSDAGLPLYLWTRVVDLDVGDSDDPASITRLVMQVRGAVAHDAGASEGLELGLRTVGYEDKPEYLTRVVRFGRSTCLGVTSDFPRIQRSAVSGAIIACRYDVATIELDRFQVATWHGVELHGE